MSIIISSSKDIPFKGISEAHTKEQLADSFVMRLLESTRTRV